MEQTKEIRKEEPKKITKKESDYDHFLLVMARLVKKYSSQLIKEH